MMFSGCGRPETRASASHLASSYRASHACSAAVSPDSRRPPSESPPVHANASCHHDDRDREGVREDSSDHPPTPFFERTGAGYP